MYTRDDNPSYKLIWALVMLSLPVFGSVIYLISDPNKVSGRTKRRLRNCARKAQQIRAQDMRTRLELKAADKSLSRQADYIRETACAPVYVNTQSEYFGLGESYFRTLLKDLKKARHFIFMEYFILDDGKMWDAVFTVLKEKTARGWMSGSFMMISAPLCFSRRASTANSGKRISRSRSSTASGREFSRS